MEAQGWYPDPYGRHDDRWVSGGKPTRLVRRPGHWILRWAAAGTAAGTADALPLRPGGGAGAGGPGAARALALVDCPPAGPAGTGPIRSHIQPWTPLCSTPAAYCSWRAWPFPPCGGTSPLPFRRPLCSLSDLLDSSRCTP